jgi:hypothetical protein
MASGADITLDFQSTNFEADLAVAAGLLTELQKECGFETGDAPEGEELPPRLFAITDPKSIGGWSLSKLHIAGPLFDRMYELHSGEIESIDIKKASSVPGKRYQGQESVLKFASWLGGRLEEKGCGAQVKIGEEMADQGYGVGTSLFGLALGKYLDKNLSPK